MERFLQLLIIFFVFSSTVFAGVNINTASEAEFEALKGIGPAKAKAIVDYRNQHGHFKSIDDLEKVSGVDIIGLFSLTFFFLFFVILSIWLLKTNKNKFNEASRLPLDNQD